MNIATSDARGLFTKMLIDVYKERTAPTSFLRSFFPSKESPTKNISIEVQRGTEKISVDVFRGTEGNRNEFGLGTEKIFAPPYYREFFDATDLDLYDRLFGSTAIDAGVFAAFLEDVADKLRMLQDKIERAYERQCAQVLQTGIVTLDSGDNIDFKRKAESLVDLGGGNYWTDAVDPFETFKTAAKFIRQEGKTQGGTYNAILGEGAHSALLNNTIFKERQDFINMPLDAIRPPQRDAVGGTLHGRISAGSYRFNIWTYPEFFDNAAGVSVPYIDDANLIVLPENPRFKLAFAAVPKLLKEGAPTEQGAFVISEYIDERATAHIMDLKSAGVAIPVAVDQIATVQVTA